MDEETSYTYDKLFLLSEDDIISEKLGFDADKGVNYPQLSAGGSDYARAQGLFDEAAEGKKLYSWWLRALGSVAGGGSYSGGGGGISGKTPDGTPFTAYPVSEKFYLIIYGEVRWLKEMYDVQLLVINNSLTDTIDDCTAELKLPDGLSLASMVDGEQSAVQTIDHIAEVESDSVHWYVRGDKEGTYDVSASLSGMLMPFEEEFHYEYVAQNPIKVYAGSAMHLTFIVPDSAFYGDDYEVKFILENVSNKTLYNVSHAITGLKQCRVTHYSDGAVVDTTYLENGFLGSEAVEEFKPGDKIVISVSTKILFESEIIESQLKELTETVDKLEGLYECYKMLKLAEGALGALGAFISGANGLIDDGLLSLSAFKNIKSMSGILNYMSFGSGGSEGFNIFDSIRTAISLIPIRFYLKNATVSTRDGSTAEIPYSIETEKVGARYFGVDNVGRYLYSLVIAGFGPIDGDIFGITFAKDITGYGEAVEYIKATEQKALALKATDVTGETTFRAWVERKGDTLKSSSRLMSADDGELFTLAVNNDTAVYENGVLTFTGGGIIKVTPNTMTGGTLFVDMGDGKVKQYDIEVVAPHECSSGTWVTELYPTATTCGFRVKYCDVCGDAIDFECIEPCDSHTFGDYTVDIAPTCTTAGIKTRTCTKCGCLEYETIASLSHTIDAELERVEPTCTQNGYVTYTCSVCGEQVTDTLKALGHDHTNWTVTKEATCSEEGRMTGYCSRCGETVTETIPKKAHKFGECVVNSEPTCCSQGSKHCTCTECGYVETTAIPIDTSSHSGGTELRNAVDATCCTTGYTGDIYCKGCGKILAPGSETPENTNNHTGGTYTNGGIAATCTADGRTDDTYCAGCDALLASGRIIKATGHSYIYTEIADNDDAHSVGCENCDYSEIQPHSYVQTGHVDATYFADGYTEYTCQNCGHVKTDAHAMLVDGTAPTGTITAAEKKSWQSFVSAVTFGLFCGGDIKINIEGADSESDISQISYYVSTTALSEAEVNAIDGSDWLLYDSAFWIEAEGQYYVYARLENTQGGATIIGTDGLVLDLTPPAVNGISDGAVYCLDTAFTVSDDYLDTVTVNDAPIMLNNGAYTLTGSGSFEIVASDSAGNVTTVAVTLNGGHTYSDWSYYDATYHSHSCFCGSTEYEPHSYSNWTVTKAATTKQDGERQRTCAVCGHTDIEAIDRIKNVTGVTLSSKGMTISYKAIETLTADILREEGATYTVVWESSNSKIARVDESGNVYGAGKGTAAITVKVYNADNELAASDTCDVMVKYVWWQWLIKIILFGWIWY